MVVGDRQSDSLSERNHLLTSSNPKFARVMRPLVAGFNLPLLARPAEGSVIRGVIDIRCIRKPFAIRTIMSVHARAQTRIIPGRSGRRACPWRRASDG